MVTIVLNGEKTEIEDDSNIEQLLQTLNIENKRLAVDCRRCLRKILANISLSSCNLLFMAVKFKSIDGLFWRKGKAKIRFKSSMLSFEVNS